MSIDASPSETISRGGVPTPKIALIREKTVLMFWDIPGSKPVWLSGAFSQRKITANSTYWEADLRQDRPYLPIREQNNAMGVGFFGIW